MDVPEEEAEEEEEEEPGRRRRGKTRGLRRGLSNKRYVL